MAQVVTLPRAEAEAPPAEVDWFVQTSAARDILLTLETLQPGRVTMIAGPPGTGKTAAVRRFIEDKPDSYYHECVADEASAWTVSRSILARSYGPHATFGSSVIELRRALVSLFGQCGWVIFDEAQNLDRKDRKTGAQGEALGWLHAVAVEAGARLVFVGGLSLPEALSRWDRLAGKLCPPVVMDRPSAADVGAYARHRGYRDEVVIAALATAAARTGGLRVVRNVLDQAERFAIGGTAGREHVRAAFQRELRMEMPT